MAQAALRNRFDNLVAMFRTRANERPECPLLRFHRDGAWHDLSYGQVFERAQAIAGGLVGLGVEVGDRVAILANNRPEWALADWGSLAAGAVVVTIYPTLTPDEVAFILRNSKTRVVFLENADQLAKVLAHRESLPELRHAIVMEGAGSADGFALSLENLAAPDTGRGAERLLQVAASATLDTPFTIVYTSGTTADPKGAVLTHGNLLCTIGAVCDAAAELIDDFKLNLSLLPLAHVLERFGGHFLPVHQGGTIAYARSQSTLPEDFKIIRPEFMMVVPRVLEKVYARVMAQVSSMPPARQRVFQWALAVGREYTRAQELHTPVHFALALKHTVANRLVFKTIRERFGGRLDAVISGGAPLAPEIASFFWAIGMAVYEGWGLTETSAPATVNLPHALRIGSVGKPLPGVELKLAEDGEILVRGYNVFSGYFENAEATHDAFTEDGFFRTGDIGRLDEEGFLYITDRKKELIITAGGKKVPPQKIENLLKMHPLVSSAIVVGDRRPCLVALLTVDTEALAREHPELAGTRGEDPAVRALLAGAVEQANRQLARFEQVKSFTVLDQDFSPETGELTVTLKPKRRVIEERYGAAIDAMYAHARAE